MMVALVCGFLTTHIVIQDAGVAVYALFSFLIAIPALVPFTDLGAGAALVNKIAGSRDADGDDEVRFTALSISRIMISSALVLIAVNAAMYLTGLWGPILGAVRGVENAETVAFISVLIFALSIPFSIGSRVFLGLERAHVLVLIQGIQAPATLMFVFLATRIAPEASGAFLSIAAFASLLLVSIAAFIGARSVLRSTFRWVGLNLSHFRRTRGSRVMHIGLPLLVQTIAAPIALQFGRFILAQTVSAEDLAVYGVAAQVYFALQSLISMAGLTLWPMFARQRANGQRARPFAISAAFAGAAALCAAAVWLLSEPFFRLLSGGELRVPEEVLLGFSLVLVIQAALYPLGMFLMDEAGARFQTVPVLLMVTLNVSLSFFLASSIGVPGPLFATAIATLVCQVVPYTIYIKRRSRQAG
jgi:O-antigen/teichoic acid export membrane protein